MRNRYSLASDKAPRRSILRWGLLAAIVLVLVGTMLLMRHTALAMEETPGTDGTINTGKTATPETGLEDNLPPAEEETQPGPEPEAPAEDESADVGMDVGDTVPLDDVLSFTEGNTAITLTVQGDATVAEAYSTPETAASVQTVQGEPASPQISLFSLDSTDADEGVEPDLTVQVAALPDAPADDTQIEALTGEGKVLSLQTLDLGFFYGDAPLDVSSCTITAQIIPDAALQQAADAMYAGVEELAPEAEIGVELTALQTAAGQTDVLGSVLLARGADTTPTLEVTLDSANPAIQLLANETANPHFMVQYYAHVPIMQRRNDGPLEVIDTSGRKLPANGEGGVSHTLNLELTKAKGGKYMVATQNVLTEVYSQGDENGKEYQYIQAPNLAYFNKLYENGNYELSQVWVLKSGAKATSTDEADWNVYNAGAIHFTNRAESVGANTILITDDTVIRLVFNTTDGTYDNAAAFYDYDITEGRQQTWVEGEGDKGINNPSNYTGDGAKLAFGNANTGVSLRNEQWKGNQLNQYNHSGEGFKGGTYGLVEGLDANGNLVYANGVIAPNLFKGTATGKTSYDSGNSLTFNRVGDTYTLSAVSGTNKISASNLEYFNHPTSGSTTYEHIWTNNFWPLDGQPGKDGLTGSYDRKKYSGQDGTKDYPLSDDGQDHNNMFGMTYAVDFDLDNDYSGPLEYLFYGDDDMWVFLTKLDESGNPNYANAKLICDIGGVHSSVGEYVNLWNYISQSDPLAKGKYRLTFFYTERGLSGSTCYMQFTLPSVSSVTPEQNTSQLTIKKVVTGGTDEQNNTDEFNFTIQLTDASDNHLLDDYAYARYAANGDLLGKNLITYDGGTFQLKNGEYVIIRYLPYGTKYTITENGTVNPNTPLDGKYTVSGTVNQGGSAASVTFTGVEASGQIKNGQNGEVVYTNKLNPKLPDTGGVGVWWYTGSGAVLLLAAAVLLRRRRAR